MWWELVEALDRLLHLILAMIGLRSGSPQLNSNTLRIFIKNEGVTLPVDLDPSWSVAEVRAIVAPKFGYTPQEIKIIFAGKELPDHLVLQDCDIGQQSFLHAVRIKVLPNGEGVTVVQNPPPSSTPQNSSEEEVQNTLEGKVQVSNFFVYCSTCGGLKEGKLRVRCCSCSSGAFTVLRDPENWEDVLTPNRVRGICENDCQPSYAQFYFKCTAHVTKGEDDSCPGLSQIRRNTEGVLCLACGDVQDPVLIFTCPKSHVVCVDCFILYANSRINSRQFTQDSTIGYTLGCPALCPDSLIQDPQHFKLMGKHNYDRYQRFGAEECLLGMGGLLCPQPNCGEGIVPADSSCNKIACLHGCGFVFCRHCLEGWHVGPCKGMASPSPSTSSSNYPILLDRAAQAQWEDPNRKALRILTKPCPKCRTPTEREGGCMHMECTRCTFQWCWVCQTEWTRECMGNHWFG